jgi:IS605 OrfB family transposase
VDRTIRLKLSINKNDELVLKKTISIFNEIFNQISEYGYMNKTSNKIKIHNVTYYNIREKYPEFPSSLLQGARDVACESLKGVKLKTLPVSSEFSAIRYNKRVITYYLKYNYVTLSTISGRIKATFSMPKYYEKYINWEVRSSTLKYNIKNNEFFLNVTMTEKNPEIKGDRILGIDRGIINIAVCSNNKFFNGKSVKNVRGKYAYVRSELQSKGTKSAKQLLKKRSRKERQFVTHVNHCISKVIVNMPFDVFVLEDLTNIRLQSSKGKNLNRRLNNWSFYQLAQFLEYKAEAIGKKVIYIDPRYTSQKCSRCGKIEKTNRNGNKYICDCGFEIHADLNASRNIAQLGKSQLSRLPVNQPYMEALAIQKPLGL